MSKYKGVIIGSSLFILLSSVFGFQYVKTEMIKEKVAEFKLPPTSVTTEQVKQKDWKKKLTVIGNIQTVQSIKVTSQIAGQVREIKFESGHKVQQGDVLIQLDDALLQSQYKSQQARVKLTKTELNRNRQLIRNHSISQKAFDQSEAQFNVESANLEYIKTQIDYMKVKAPFSGTVGIRSVDIGDYISQSTAIVALEDNSKQFVDFSISELYLSEVKVGQFLKFTSDAAPGKTFNATISAIEPSADQSTHNINVRAVTNQSVPLESGMYVNAVLTTSETNDVIQVPSVAVNYTLYGDTVYVLDPTSKRNNEQDSQLFDYNVIQRSVKIGPKQDGYVGVISGLNDDDIVITSNQQQLKNGSTVVVNNQNPLITK